MKMVENSEKIKKTLDIIEDKAAALKIAWKNNKELHPDYVLSKLNYIQRNLNVIAEIALQDRDTYETTE